MPRTEQELYCKTLVKTLPSKKRAIAPNPLASVTIRSIFFCEATFRISSAGFPSRHTSSTTYPALCS